MAWRECEGTIVVPFHHIAQDGSLKPTAEGTYLQAGDEWIDLPHRGGLGTQAYVERHGVRTLGVWCASRQGPGQARMHEEHPLRVRRGLGWFRWRDGSRRHGGWEIHELHDGDGRLLMRWEHKWLFFRQAPDGSLSFLDQGAPGIDEEQDLELEALDDRPALGGPGQAVDFTWTLRETDQNQHVFYRSYLERTENVLADAGVDVSAFPARATWYAAPALLGDPMTGLVEQRDGDVLVALTRSRDGAACTLARFWREGP